MNITLYDLQIVHMKKLACW